MVKIKIRGGRFAEAKRRQALGKNQVKAVKKIARSVAQGMCEKKHFTWMDENKQLLHNKGDYVTNFLACKQGITDNEDGTAQLNRIGDEILLKDVTIRLWLSNKAARPNVMYKAFLFWYDPDAVLSDSYAFFSAQNKMLDRVNTEVLSIIDSKVIFSQNNYAPDYERSQLCTLKARYKGRKIKYDEGGGTPKFKTLGLCVVCYDAYGTLQTDNIASYAYNATIGFIDP